MFQHMPLETAIKWEFVIGNGATTTLDDDDIQPSRCVQGNLRMRVCVQGKLMNDFLDDWGCLIPDRNTSVA